MRNALIFPLIVFSILAGCKSKKNTTETTSEPNDNAMQLAAARTKFPNATEPEMKKGKEVYFGTSCTSCHGAKAITNVPAEEWPSIIDRMAIKAKITEEEKDAVLKYVTGVKGAAR